MTRRIGKRILIALDGSEHSLATVHYVNQMISDRLTRVTLFNVFSSIPESFMDLATNPQYHMAVLKADAWSAHQKKSITAFMEEASHSLHKHGFQEKGVLVNIHPMEQGIARDIEAESGKGYDAVVIGRRGSGKIKELVIGSTADKLANRLSHIPICIVSGNSWPQKTLVAFDGSKGSNRGVEFLSSNLSHPDHEIMLLHVVRSSTRINTRHNIEPALRESESAWLNDHLKNIKPVMEKAKEKLVESGFKKDMVNIKIVTGVHSRAETIMREVNSGEYGTLVIGRRGLSDVQDHVMGRVCNKVIHMVRNRAIWVVN